MDPQVSTSFIPKKPLDGGSSYHSSAGGAFSSLIVLVALLIFITSIVAAGAAFLYKTHQETSIQEADANVKKSKDAFKLEDIQELVRLDSRINNARALLASHVAPSAIFDFLSAQTLENVQFSNFTYSLNPGGSAAISLTGQADNFSSVALQSDQFGSSKVLKDVIFSGITQNPGGRVLFTVAAIIDPSLLNYGKNLGQGALQVAPTQPAATSTLPAGQTPSGDSVGTSPLGGATSTPH